MHPIFNTEYYWPITQIVLPAVAGLPMNNAQIAPPNLVPALLHQFPLFLGAHLSYNWAQLPDLPGFTQLYPLALLVAIFLFWGTLRAEVFPRMRPRMHDAWEQARAGTVFALQGFQRR